MGTHILIAEDDLDIIELLTLYLESNGFTVFAASNGIKALELVKEREISLALVDIMMPGMNGYDLIREIRKESNIPIIVLSAKSSDTDKVLGLDVGADTYLTKPFNPLEVVAYVKALCRRYYHLGSKESGELAAERLRMGELELDLEKCVLKKRGEIVPLTSTEMKIIIRFMKNPGRVFTKAQIYECINSECFENDEKTMAVHIYNIRAKLEDDPRKPKYIKTVRGLGYKFEAGKE